jgi:hypothetical protein
MSGQLSVSFNNVDVTDSVHNDSTVASTVRSADWAPSAG